MEESELIPKNVTGKPGRHDFHDAERISVNIWKVSRDGKFWTIKTRKDLTAASEILLRREYNISRNFQHPFILTPTGFEEQTPFGAAIVMEYIDGRNLESFVRERPSTALRRKVLSQILDAVGYLHNKGVLHNDIKADNIIVTSIGNNVKLIDFNLAEVSGDYLNRRLGGTRWVSAPEVMEGNVDMPSTAASDIFCLGGIISLLFPGRYLTIVNKCHRNDPIKRYQDIQSLESAIKLHNRIPVIIAVLLCMLCMGLTQFRGLTTAPQQIPADSLTTTSSATEPNTRNDASSGKEPHISAITQPATEPSRSATPSNDGPSGVEPSGSTVSSEKYNSSATPRDDTPSGTEHRNNTTPRNTPLTDNIKSVKRPTPEEVENPQKEIFMQEIMRRAEYRRRDSMENTKRLLNGNHEEVREVAWKIYLESADSLDDYNLVPCQEFAYAIITNYGRRIRALDKQHVSPNMKVALEEEHDYGLSKLSSRIFKMLTMNDLLLLGVITEEERDRMQKLVNEEKPFTTEK